MSGAYRLRDERNTLFCIEDLRKARIVDLGIILGNVMPEKVQEFLGTGSKFSVKLTYVPHGERTGIAYAVNCFKEFVGDEPFVATSF